jgi:isoleucyl-tRNA synthetase
MSETPVFQSLPTVPDHPALEQEILAWWEAEGTFEQLRAQNAGGPIFSFFDGPVTANKTLGVHTAWGRTLKDAFQRQGAPAASTSATRTGFDCRGSGSGRRRARARRLNSKRRSRKYGLEKFARKCREARRQSADQLTRLEAPRAVDGLGQRLLVQRHTNISTSGASLAIVHERDCCTSGTARRVVPALRTS